MGLIGGVGAMTKGVHGEVQGIGRLATSSGRRGSSSEPAHL